MRILFIFAALFFLCSCGIFDGAENRSKLKNISAGMTKDEVLSVMGAPVTGEIYSTDNLWFYYTNPRWFDGLVTRDECTPFVFDAENGRLLGFGYDFYHTEYGIPDWPLEKR